MSSKNMDSGVLRSEDGIISQSLFNILTGAVILLSAAAMIAAARGDLWLDEVTSLSFTGQARSVWDIFTVFHHDNNHPLNTLFLYLVGNQNHLFIYRFPAVVSGIGSILLIGHIARRDWGRMEGLCGVLLAGTSFPLLLYFSEARGYAPAVFFGLAACAILQANLRHYRTLRLVLFWAVSILGILSHATFIMLTASFVVWNLADEAQNKEALRQKAGRLTAHHLPPFAFFIWWYLFFLKDMTIDGGPIYSVRTIVGEACALLLGLPDTTGLRIAAMILVAAVTAAGAISLYHKRDSKWILFPAVIVLAPALMLLLNHPSHLYFRYFFVCFPFFLLILAYLLCDWYRSSALPLRLLSVIAIALLLIGQLPRDYILLKLGRGEYTAAFKYIVDHSPGRAIVYVGSDHDFRNKMMFDFYSARIASGSRLRYVENSQWAQHQPVWIIRHSNKPDYRPAESLLIKGIGKYHLERTYTFCGHSGFSWALFREENLPSRWIPRPSGGI